jgi:hypothetical protein
MTITVATCTTTVNASALSAALRVVPALPPLPGQPPLVPPPLGVTATHLALNGTVNVTPACGLPTTMSVVADKTTVASAPTGAYVLSGALTEF